VRGKYFVELKVADPNAFYLFPGWPAIQAWVEFVAFSFALLKAPTAVVVTSFVCNIEIGPWDGPLGP
jgi:hypothetical protein